MPQTPKNNKQQNVTTRISRYADYADPDDDEDLYEDASKSENTSPTPGEKYSGPSTKDRQKTHRAVDLQWSALEADEAQRDLVDRLNKIVDLEYNAGFGRQIPKTASPSSPRRARKRQRLLNASPLSPGS